MDTIFLYHVTLPPGHQLEKGLDVFPPMAESDWQIQSQSFSHFWCQNGEISSATSSYRREQSTVDPRNIAERTMERNNLGLGMNYFRRLWSLAALYSRLKYHNTPCDHVWKLLQHSPLDEWDYDFVKFCQTSDEIIHYTRCKHVKSCHTSD